MMKVLFSVLYDVSEELFIRKFILIIIMLYDFLTYCCLILINCVLFEYLIVFITFSTSGLSFIMIIVIDLLSWLIIMLFYSFIIIIVHNS